MNLKWTICHNESETQAVASLPFSRPLAQTLYEPSSLIRELAVAMALHPRLGEGSLLNALGVDMLRKVVSYADVPVSYPEFIVQELHLRFTGLLPPSAVSHAVSVDDASACVHRLRSFSELLYVRLKAEHARDIAKSMDAKLPCSHLAPKLPACEYLLSILLGQQALPGATDHYLFFISWLLGARFVHVDESSRAINIVVSARQANSRPVVIGPAISEIQGDVWKHEAQLDQAMSRSLHEILATSDYSSCWLMHGIRGGFVRLGHKYMQGSGFVSLKMQRRNGMITGTVLDPRTSTPDLSELTLCPGMTAMDMLQHFFKESEAEFFQTHGATSHQALWGGGVYHALLGLASQVEEKPLPSAHQ